MGSMVTYSSLQWIKSFLANRTQRVLVEGHTSSPAPVTQGTVLDPLLFIIYINKAKSDPVPGNKEPRRCSDPTGKPRQPTRIGRRIGKCCSNASKCGGIYRVTQKQNPIKITYTIHGHDLTVNKTGKYLGVSIAYNLT